jgi:hypothetical protein
LLILSDERGYFTQGKGRPDEARAARTILKDYVNGKLLYCVPPPGIDGDEFNAEHYVLVDRNRNVLGGGIRFVHTSRTQDVDSEFFKPEPKAVVIQTRR